jgi:hypothetical protein
MNEKFCPPDCNFKKLPVKFRADCHCQNTVEYKSPRPIELLWYAGVWIKAFIIGEEGDNYLVTSEKAEGHSTIKKGSKLIR